MMDEVTIYSMNKVKQVQINHYINTKEQIECSANPYWHNSAMLMAQECQ